MLDELKRQLDAEPAGTVLEYLAERFGLTGGNASFEVVLENGQAVRGYVKRWGGRQAIEELGRPEAPPLDR